MKKKLNRVLRSPGVEPVDSMNITVEEVLSALKEMPGSKAGGPDGLHPRLLKMLPVEGIERVRELFNRSFTQGVVP